jgi:hypothetical protein
MHVSSSRSHDAAKLINVRGIRYTILSKVRKVRAIQYSEADGSVNTTFHSVDYFVSFRFVSFLVLSCTGKLLRRVRCEKRLKGCL